MSIDFYQEHGHVCMSFYVVIPCALEEQETSIKWSAMKNYVADVRLTLTNLKIVEIYITYAHHFHLFLCCLGRKLFSVRVLTILTRNKLSRDVTSSETVTNGDHAKDIDQFYTRDLM